MSSPSRFRIRKIAKVIALIGTIVTCGFFLFIFGATYLFLNSIGKDGAVNKKNENKRAETEPSVSYPSNSSEIASPVERSDQLQEVWSNQDVPRDNSVSQGLLFIKKIVELRQDQRFLSAPPICEIICQRSTWANHSEGVEIWDQFNSFLEREGSRAFDDPNFRLIYERINSYADVLMVVGEALKKIDPMMQRKNELSEAEKIYWSVKAPIIISHVATKMSGLIPKSKKQNKLVNEMIELRKRCGEHSFAEIEDSCLSMSEGLSWP